MMIMAMMMIRLITILGQCFSFFYRNARCTRPIPEAAE
jgi:hypothetical protein